MQFELTLTKKDLIIFNLYQQKQSLACQKSLKQGKLLFPILMLLIVIASYLGKADPFLFKIIAILSVIGSIIFILSLNYITNKLLVKRINKILDEGKGGVFNPELSIITFSDINIIDESHDAKLVIKYEKIEKLCFNCDYLYIYISALTAFIIPDSVFNNNLHKQQFINFIQEKTGLQFI